MMIKFHDIYSCFCLFILVYVFLPSVVPFQGSGDDELNLFWGRWCGHCGVAVWKLPSQLNPKWQLVTGQASWPARGMHGLLAFRGRLWVLGGLVLTPGVDAQRQSLNDVWFSGDGATWSVATLQAIWRRNHWRDEDQLIDRLLESSINEESMDTMVKRKLCCSYIKKIWSVMYDE